MVQYAAQTACQKLGGKSSFYVEPASHFPSDASFRSQKGERCRSSCTLQKKSEGCLDWPNRPSVPGSFVAAGLVWHDEQGLSSIRSSPDPGSSCQSMHKSSNGAFFLFYSPEQMQQADTQSFTQNRCKHTHASIPTRHKQNQEDLCLLRERKTITLVHTWTQTHSSVIHAMMPLPWEGLLRHPQPAFLTDSYKKRPITKPWAAVRIREISGQATLHSFVSPVKRLQK